MPVYEYKCRNCGNDFEELIRGEDIRINCPVCNSEECDRKFSVFGFNSGSGFVSSASSGGCQGCHASPGKCKNCK